MRCTLEPTARSASISSRLFRSRALAMSAGSAAISDHEFGPVRIFIVEAGDCDFEALQLYLSSFGFNVTRCKTQQDVARLWDHRSAAVCLLALHGRRDNTSVIGEFAKHLACGLIVVAQAGDASDCVIGLELGADDYLIEPFQHRELIARIRSVLRRSLGVTRAERPSKAHFGKWSFSPSTLELRNVDGRTETLTAAEADLLMAMISRPNRLLSREQLQGDDVVDDPAFERSIDVRISRIRKKIECDPRSPIYIKTVYGAGYIFCATVNWT